MSHKELNVIEKNSIKACRYKCGTIVYWSDDEQYKDKKLRWVELESGKIHDFPRCADLLKEQGKDLGVLKRK